MSCLLFQRFNHLNLMQKSKMNNLIKKLSVLAVSIGMGISGLYAQAGFGEAEAINSDWRFHLGDIQWQASAETKRGAWQQVRFCLLYTSPSPRD